MLFQNLFLALRKANNMHSVIIKEKLRFLLKTESDLTFIPSVYSMLILQRSNMAEQDIEGKKLPIKLAIRLIPFLAVFIIGVVAAVSVVKSKPEILGLSKGQVQIQAEADALVAEVKKLIDLPKDEKPTVATVTDIDKVKDQPFFKNAKNGDKVIIYTNAKKAILYRQTEKRIIEVGALNINQQTQVAGTQSSKFIIFNGTKAAGLTKTMEESLKKALPSAEVTDRANAAKSDYQQSLIVDLTGKQLDNAQQLAKTLNLKVSNLPEGETKPENVDFLIIIGQDKVPTPVPTSTPSTPTPNP